MIVTPIIHLNGTNRQDLLDKLDAVFAHVTDAMDRLRKAAPNQRDYYPEPGRWEKALAQHRQRQEHLQAVLESLQQEVDAIVEKGWNNP